MASEKRTSEACISCTGEAVAVRTPGAGQGGSDGGEQGEPRALFGLPAPKPVYPPRLKAMWALHGRLEGCRCATCAHLFRLQYSRAYYKCSKSAMTHGAATNCAWAGPPAAPGSPRRE